MIAGEKQAWDILAELNPEDVSSRAKVSFDKSSGRYLLKSFLQDIFIPPKDRDIFGHSAESHFILNRLGRYSILSILWYLTSAKDIPSSGRLVKPSDITGGLIYQRGSHVLPLDKIAQKYGRYVQRFLKKGKELGGERLGYGDASLRLHPLPRVPITIILWGKDKEFSARCSLLLDSTCQFHLPADIIWSTAMMTVLIML